MSDEGIDARLAARLRDLAAAVPVDAVASSLDLLTTSRPRERRITTVARASVGMVGVIAVLAVVVVIGLRPGPATGGPVIGNASDGPFRLTITVPRAVYSADEEITGITATLTYTGPDGDVRITNDRDGPISFGVAEVGGTHRMSPISDLVCGGSDLVRDVPVSAVFTKSGAIQSTDDPEYPWFSAYFARPGLFLDPGTWTITAIASFETDGGCAIGGGPGTQHLVRASATITVSAGGTSPTFTAAPTPKPEATPTPTPLPPGGISEARAIELARSNAAPDSTIVSAQAGPYRDLWPEGHGDGISPDRLVWAVTFAGNATICNPLGVCESPRPGTLTVYLDFVTGAFLESAGYAPAGTATPSPDTSIPICQPDQVSMVPEGYGAAAGTTYLTIQLNFLASQPCRWPANPAIAIRDAAGKTIAAAAAGGDTYQVLSSDLGFRLGWASWCAPAPAAPLALVVTLEAGREETMTLPDGFRAGCMDVPTIIFLEQALP